MPLTVELRFEYSDRPYDKLLPCGGFLNHGLPEMEAAAYPILGAIDRYGSTAFNYLQMDEFLRGWDTLDLTRLTAEQALDAAKLRRMAVRCKNDRLLLWFEGD